MMENRGIDAMFDAYENLYPDEKSALRGSFVILVFAIIIGGIIIYYQKDYGKHYYENHPHEVDEEWRKMGCSRMENNIYNSDRFIEECNMLKELR